MVCTSDFLHLLYTAHMTRPVLVGSLFSADVCFQIAPKWCKRKAFDAFSKCKRRFQIPLA